MAAIKVTANAEKVAKAHAETKQAERRREEERESAKKHITAAPTEPLINASANRRKHCVPFPTPSHSHSFSPHSPLPVTAFPIPVCVPYGVVRACLSAQYGSVYYLDSSILSA